MVVLSGDLNGYEGVHGGFSYGIRNMDGETILESGDAMDMIVCGTQFKKNDNKIVTYSPGGLNTMVDYLMIHKHDRKCLWEKKAIPGEEALSQHHLIRADMKARGAVKAQRKKFLPRRKVRRQFQDKLVLGDAGEGDVNVVWEKTGDC